MCKKNCILYKLCNKLCITTYPVNETVMIKHVIKIIIVHSPGIIVQKIGTQTEAHDYRPIHLSRVLRPVVILCKY